MVKNEVTDAAFLREVDEEYRRSQVAGLWARYGRLAVIAVAVLLVAVAGGLYWRAERARAAGVAGEELTQALAKIDAGDMAGAAPVLARLATAPQPGYRALAQLAQAAAAVQAKDTATAVKLYDHVAADTAVAAPFRDLATVKSVRLQYDTLSPAAIVGRLALLSVPGNPWFPIAGEMSALAQVRAGNRALALPLLTAIVRDAGSPPNVRGRCAQLAIALGAKPADLAAPAPRVAGAAK